MEINLLVAKKLKKLRILKGFSQEKVAEHLQISQSAYNRIEHGSCHSWVNHITLICNLYNINPEELLKKENTIDAVESKITEKNSFTLYTEKLIEEHELRLQEKDAYITTLEKLVDKNK